jgi:UDPglucose 6-dehydrogenase/GDP-mannose 6-dehydrogenase
MKISIVGTGYVGLVTGACLADRGHTVICVDVAPEKVAMINSGRAPIHEVGLPEILTRTVGKSLAASGDLAAAVVATEITFIAVGTPAHDGKIDLSYIERAAAQIGAALANKSSYHTVVVKSTVIPGTTSGLVKTAVEKHSGKKAGADFGVGMNPEFLTEGQAVADFDDPDRLVIGGIDARSQQHIARVYDSYPEVVPRIFTNCSTAEMIKYTSNSVLATMISFSNEIGRLCEAVGGVDVAEVMRGVHAAAYFTQRNGSGQQWRAPITGFLDAGCGFGGSCLPKDVTALVAQGKSHSIDMPLLASVLSINRGQPARLLQLVQKHFAELAGRRVTVLGLAFKPDTDDLRESPAFPIIRELRKAKANVTAYDPIVQHSEHPDLQGVPLAKSFDAALANAEIVIHVTKWQEFTTLAQRLKALGSTALVVDGRRNLNPQDFARYEGIGR